MKKKFFAMTAAFLLTLTPLTAHAAAEPIEPSVADGSVHFPRDLSAADFGLIVSSNQECTVMHENNGCTFTPEEDGRYVVSTRDYCEEIVDCGTSEVSGHFHYFYPVLNNYTVDVEDGEITVTERGTKSWYSEEQINAEVLAMNEAIAAEEIQYIACYDVYAADPDDVLNVNYFSFVNGQLPDGTNGYDSYITNVYGEYGTESYFCVNYCCADVQQDVNGNEPQKVYAEEQDISSLLTYFWTSSTCDDDLTAPSPDMMEFARISAPELDGDLTVSVDDIVNDLETYLLTVEEGIFHHRKATSDLMGDCNLDGKFSVTDVVMLQKWLVRAGELTCWQNADFTEDGRIDGFDLALMKRALLEEQKAIPMLIIMDEQIIESETGWGSRTYFEVIGTDGKHYTQEITGTELAASDYLTAAEELLSGSEGADCLSAEDLSLSLAFTEDAAGYHDAEMTEWSLQIADYGEEILYAVCDGQLIELCRFGEECAWLDNAEVQVFVTMLIENGYYADSDIFEWYLENN